MKIRSKIIGVMAAGCAISAGLPQGLAAVSDEEFKALRDLVLKQGQRIEQLEQTHQQDQKTHLLDQQVHEQDQKQFQQLKQQLGETQKTASEAQQKADEAAKVQPVHPIPSGGLSATHNFTMVGDAEVQFGKVQGQHSAFALADFAPIFLYRAGDKVLFEAGFDVTLQNNDRTSGGGSSTHVDLSFAQLDYLLNDYAMFVGGAMVLPLGTYSERTAGWLNKIPDDPLARDVLPGSGVGIQLRGAVPVGESGQHISYSLYGANGPSSIDGTGKALQADGITPNLDLGGNVGDTPNWHANPSAGGRVGWFVPWKAHYDLELGISGQSGQWDDAGKKLWSAAVFDAALHVSPYVEVKGEYIHSWVDTEDLGTIRPRGWWVQAGYKLAGLNLELPLINNVELVGRFDKMNDALGTKTERYTAGYVYYFSNTLLFEGDYEFLHSHGPAAMPANALIFQLSYGF